MNSFKCVVKKYSPIILYSKSYKFRSYYTWIDTVCIYEIPTDIREYYVLTFVFILSN